MSVNYEALGKRIRYRRSTLRLTQAEVASAINISLAFYGNIERGTRIPSLDTLVAIANALQIGLDFLLGDSLSLAVQTKRLTPEARNVLRNFFCDQMAELDYDS